MPNSADAPRLPGLPLLGNALQAVAEPCRFFADAHQRLGPVFRVRYPGRELLVMAGLEANRFFAREGAEHFSNAETYARMTREMGTDTMPNCQDGKAHTELRRQLGPSLSLQALEPFVPRLFAMIDAHCQRWRDGRTSTLQSAIRRLVADLVSVASTGKPLGALGDRVGLYATMMGVVAVGGALPERTLYLPPVQRARRAFAGFLQTTIDERRDRARERDRRARAPDLIDALLELADRDPGRFDDDALLALAMLPSKNAGIYLYRMISFVLYETLRRPELRAQLEAEVDAAFASAEGPAAVPSMVRIKAMATLNAVILETLRLYPMAIALPRVVCRPFQFESYDFEPGQALYIAGPACHFLTKAFDQPEQFDPARYGPGRNEHRRPFAFAPFGLGRHSCMARAYSVTMAKIVVAGLLRQGRLELAHPKRALKVRGFPRPIPEARFSVRVAPRRRPAVVGPTTPLPRGESISAAIAALPRSERQRIRGDLTTVRFAAGETVFNQGDTADSFYVIEEGEALVLLEQGEAEQQLLARLGPGQCFGEIGLLQAVPRTATVRCAADGPLETLRLGRDAFNVLAVECDFTISELTLMMQRRFLIRNLAAAMPGLDLASLPDLAGSCRTLVVSPGEAIVRQGETARRFYLLTEGEVEVVNHHPSGDDIVVATLEAVDYFGEIGLLERRPRTATVRATGPQGATVLAIERDAFERLLQASGTAREEMAMAVSTRLLELLKAR